jgi:predicted AlkP superfamily pyrophosphatase or phosphodiesterase
LADKIISKPLSQLDIAPTVASVLGFDVPELDGHPIGLVQSWGCKDVVIIIVDSLGYDLFIWLMPDLQSLSDLANDGHLFRAKAVSNHTTPAIASILSGLLPEHHGIFDKAGAKTSSILSLPEMASASGLKAAVIMEKNGAEVYEGLIEITGGISDRMSPQEFDREVCRMTIMALSQKPRLLVTYFIGIDKSVHLGQGLEGIREAALDIDRCIGKIAAMVDEKTLLILCGDHPIHAGPLKRNNEPYSVALMLAKGRAKKGENHSFR